MARRATRSEHKVRFLQPAEFEDEAAVLLAEYGRLRSPVTAPPVPIEDIIETHLHIEVEFRDFRSEFPDGDVLGAIYFNDKRIAVDQSLVPDDFPSMLGRYRFTLAHELGHWRLHRHHFLRRANERELLPSAPARADHVFRARAQDPLEVQANRFAACVLMPREMIKRAWHERRGSMDPIYLDDLRTREHEILPAEILRRGGIVMSDEAISNVLFENFCRPLAELFEVSPEAMRIRLERLKLLLRKKEASLF